MKEFSALRKRIRVKWHPDGSARMTIRDQHGDFSEIGRIETTDSSIVDWQKQKLATRGQIKHTWIDPKFRGMGLATKMYGEAMKQAPRGRLVSDNAQFDGGYAIWNRLQRNRGYKIRENPKADGAGDGFVSRDKRPLFIGRINPAARKQNDLSAKLRLRVAVPNVEEYALMRARNDRNARNTIAKMIRKGRAGGDVYEELNLSAKLRLREFARGDYAIPALGKMLKDRSFLEEFLTGKRGPKMGDLRHNFNGGIFAKSSRGQPFQEYPDLRRPRQQYPGRGHIPGLLRANGGLWGNQLGYFASARQKGRDTIAKMIRKGRAGGDVYEEIVRS